MRAFIAIKLPLDIENTLAKIQDKLKLTLPKISWVKPINLHLSLKFLGEISISQADQIQQTISEIIRSISKFQIKLTTLGIFPDSRAARIIWIGTNQPPAQLIQFVEQLEKNLLKSGIPNAQCAFQAHITLGRIKHPLNHLDLEKTLNKFHDEINDMNLKLNVRGITLFQSVLGPGGPTYTILKETTF